MSKQLRHDCFSHLRLDYSIQVVVSNICLVALLFVLFLSSIENKKSTLQVTDDF